jgi:hypothetical protein
MPRRLGTFLRLTPVVAGACALSVAGLVAFRSVTSIKALLPAANEMGNYLQTVGGIYAVLLAFVVYVVWGQFNEVRGYIDREASALVDLHRSATALAPDTRAAIHEGLLEYINAVLRDEWTAMARRDEAAIQRVGESLDRVWLAIHACVPASDCQHVVYGEVLSRFNDVTDLRASRLSAARTRIPLVMKILLYTGGVLVTASMYLVAIPQFWLHAGVTAALAGAIAHILYLIADLDDPFEGDGHVSKNPYERARESFVHVRRLVEGEPKS